MDKTINSPDTNQDAFKNNPQVSGSSETIGADVSSSISTGATGARSKINDVKNKIVNQAGPAVDYLKTNFSTVSDRTQGYLQDASSMVRRYPLYSLLGAVAVGTIVGLAISRPTMNKSMKNMNTI